MITSNMVITTKHVDESNSEEILRLMQNNEAVINIDSNDVKSTLVGREGILYQAVQDDGVDNSTFIRNFFDELKKKDEVLNCTSMLISIEMPCDESLLMEDMDIIQNFVDSLNNENLDTEWSVGNNEDGEKMKILTMCTKEIA